MQFQISQVTQYNVVRMQVITYSQNSVTGSTPVEWATAVVALTTLVTTE